MKRLFPHIFPVPLLAALSLLVIALSSPAIGAPVLRDSVTVDSDIVTVGDMFENAGINAERAMFRSPAPGTVGQVSLENIRIAAAKVGVTEFENPGLFNVSVARTGIAVDIPMLQDLVTRDLEARGTILRGTRVQMVPDTTPSSLFARNTANPVTLTSLQYQPVNHRFTARFNVAGQPRPLDISGRLEFSILAPHLTRNLSAGTILKPQDIEMREIPARFAAANGVPTLDQLVGQQLVRNQLYGAVLSLRDVARPTLISRNQVITLFYRAGPMTLTVKGQALADAAQGESISVLNLMSNTVIQGIAEGPGTVRVTTGNNAAVASL